MQLLNKKMDVKIEESWKEVLKEEFDKTIFSANHYVH